jgi:hypothetical protein
VIHKICDNRSHYWEDIEKEPGKHYRNADGFNGWNKRVNIASLEVVSRGIQTFHALTKCVFTPLADDSYRIYRRTPPENDA